MNAFKLQPVLKLASSRLFGYRGLHRLTWRGHLSPLSSQSLLLKNSPQLSSVVAIRSFHSSRSSYAKKKGGKKDSDEDDSSDGKSSVELPKVKAFESSMDNTVKWVLSELTKIKVGAITADMFANLPLSGTSYGTVGKAGQVLMKTSTKLVVSVYDPTLTTAVSDALKSAGFNLNPSIEGNNVNATIPRPSKEAREHMVANASKMAEKVGYG
ncbi:ribosome-recycling factor [archaeon]|nr:MAG: ribosome-recycling factor [archaeon]